MENSKIALAIELTKNEEMQFLLDSALRENERLRKELDSAQIRIETLKEELDYYRKLIHTASTEKRRIIEKTPTTQLLMPFQEGEVVPSAEPAEQDTEPVVPETTSPENAQSTTSEKEPTTESKKRKRGRKSLPAHLPRDEKRSDPGINCPCCNHEREILGEETSERIKIIPAKVIVLKTIRIKRVCKNLDCEKFEEVEIAPLEPQIIPQGLPTAETLASVITAKFADGTPLYRQQAQLARIGLDISRNTLANWIVQASQSCYTLGKLLLEEVRAGPVINMDETELQVIKEPDRKSTTKSYMWVARGGLPDKPAIVFHYSTTRAGTVAYDILGSFQGFLQTDGYKGYEFVGKRLGIRHMGCLAHVRRKFLDVEVIHNGNFTRGIASKALNLINSIYDVERMADLANMTPDQRKTLRQEKARPLFDRLKTLLDTYKDAVLPKSLLGKAIAYALNQWNLLLVYLEDGRLRPDNNLAENSIRPFVVGRKNWLFSYSQEGATASALFYSLVETAKANGLEPYAYLKYLFTELPKAKRESEIKALLPQYVDRSKIAA